MWLSWPRFLVAFWNYWADSVTFCRFHEKGRICIVKLSCILPIKNNSKCKNAKEIQRIWHLVPLKVLCRITGKLWQILREYVFENTFVASCNFVCIPHFISVGQISSVFSNKRKEFQWWKNSSKRRRQSSFRFTGRLLWLVSPKKYKLFSRKKNMFAFLKCVVRIPIYSAVKISFRCYADLTNSKKWSKSLSNLYYLFLFAS